MSKAASVIEALLSENSYEFETPFDPKRHAVNLELAKDLRERAARLEPEKAHLHRHYLYLAHHLEAGTSSHAKKKR